eukprot:g7022.t1
MSTPPSTRRIDALLRHVGAPPPAARAALSPQPTGVLSDAYAVATAELLETERDGGWLVGRVLRAHGVKFVFTLSGGHISPVLVGAKALGIRVIDVRHEVNSVFAADAVARLTGVPGVAAVTAGPGCTNTITAVKNAQMAQSPVVLIGGAAATLTQGRGALQDIDQMSLFSPVCKWTRSCRNARELVPTMREAFRQAASGVPGPVFVELPLDVIYPLAEARAGMGLSVRDRAGRVLAQLDDLERRIRAAAAAAGAGVGAGGGQKDAPRGKARTAVTPEAKAAKRDAKKERAEARAARASILARLRLPVESGHAPGPGADADKALAWLKTKPADSSVFLEPEPGARGVPPWYVRSFMNLMLRRLCAGAWTGADRDGEAHFAPLPVEVPTAPSATVSQVAALLATAERPVFVLGSQATLLAGRVGELRAALEALGAPCFLGGMARGLLGRNNSVHVRQNRGAALRRADVVVLLGAVTDFRMDYGRSLPKGGKVKIVAANRCPDMLTLNSPLFWKADVSVVADPCLLMLDVAKAMAADGSAAALHARAAPWTAERKAAEAAKEAANARQARLPALDKSGAKRMVNPLELMHALEEELPEDSILVADGGDFVATASYVLRPRGPLRWLDPGAFGTLGVGGGFALGAKLVRPSAQVWIVWGDGSAGYSIAEVDTMARHGVPVVALVGNDAGWTQIEREQVPMFGDDVACRLAYRPYNVVAQGYGGQGLLLTHDVADDGDGPDDEAAAARRHARTAAVIKEAQRLADGPAGSPVVINAEIGGTNFREGSISV